MRSRTVDVLEPSTLKDTKQPKKEKDKTSLTKLPAKTHLNPKEPMVEDISDLQPSSDQPSTPFPPKNNVNSSPENNFKADLVHNSLLDEEKTTKNATEKENLAARNTKMQVEKPFNLET